MYPAIFSRTYPAKDVAEVFAAAAADGYKGVQANLSSAGLASLPESLPAGIGARFAHQAKAHGIRIAALSGTYNMAHPDERARQAARAGFRNVVMAARDMGAPVVSLCTGSRNEQDMWTAHPGNNDPAAWSDLRAELQFALDLAQEAGIKLAVEPEPANVVCDARAARRLLDEMAAPHLGVILDAANLLSPETLPNQYEVMREAAELLGNFLLLAHAKDIDAAGQVVAPGEGAIDLPAFAQVLRSVGYDGALIAHGFSADKAKDAANFLARLVTLASEEPL